MSQTLDLHLLVAASLCTWPAGVPSSALLPLTCLPHSSQQSEGHRISFCDLPSFFSASLLHPWSQAQPTVGTIPLQSWRPGTLAVLQTRWCFWGDHKHTTFRPPLLPDRVVANSGSSLWMSLSQAHFSRGSPIFNSQAAPPLCGGQGESKKVALHLCVERCNEQETYTQESCPKWPKSSSPSPLSAEP